MPSDGMIFINQSKDWSWITSVYGYFLSVISKAHVRASWCHKEPAKSKAIAVVQAYLYLVVQTRVQEVLNLKINAIKTFCFESSKVAPVSAWDESWKEHQSYPYNKIMMQKVSSQVFFQPIKTEVTSQITNSKFKETQCTRGKAQCEHLFTWSRRCWTPWKLLRFPSLKLFLNKLLRGLAWQCGSPNNWDTKEIHTHSIGSFPLTSLDNHKKDWGQNKVPRKYPFWCRSGEEELQPLQERHKALPRSISPTFLWSKSLLQPPRKSGQLCCPEGTIKWIEAKGKEMEKICLKIIYPCRKTWMYPSCRPLVVSYCGQQDKITDKTQ